MAGDTGDTVAVFPGILQQITSLDVHADNHDTGTGLQLLLILSFVLLAAVSVGRTYFFLVLELAELQKVAFFLVEIILLQFFLCVGSRNLISVRIESRSARRHDS